ncbi:glycosyltransferase family 4 protein [Pseudogemmobacter bohemicus]|uniref:glycosyltransferase family 4 protein n=1 Tax=Pseudogemmobacter bohemicus TaxID=2250708 RepID=UPI000DD4487E|nr:glycosyltransferase family 4 protein [Pseudogemmobacter bohemicus]
MHVLMSVNAAWNIRNFRMPVLQHLLDEGHRVTILAPRDESVPELEALGCRFIALEMDAKGLNPLKGLALRRRLARIFASEKPDVILSYTIKNNIFGALAVRRSGIPFVPNVSGLGTAFLSGGLLQRVAEGLYRRAFRRLDTVFFQNDEDRDLFLARRLVRQDQAQLLPGSGIDLDHFPATAMPEPARPPVFLMIARLLRDKGVMEYVGAARLIRARHPGARFQLLGATGSENRTAIGPETVAAWEAEGVIEYLGTTRDVRPFIAAADCVVLPSYREGAPRTLIEAGAMARPVITTDVPGCRSVVAVGETGLLCNPRDAESLAQSCLGFLALSPDDRRKMGLAGRQRMERLYDQQIVVDAYKTAIGEAVTRRQKEQA